MNNKRVLRPGTWLVAASLVLGISVVHAAPTLYRGLDNLDLSGGGAHPTADAARAQFLAAVGAVAVQSFERAGDGIAAGAVPASFSVGATTVTFSAPGAGDRRIVNGAGDFSTFATDGSQFLYALVAAGATFYSMTFDTPTAGLGFYLTDANDWAPSDSAPGVLLARLEHADGQVEFVDVMEGANAGQVVNGNVAFFGAVDAANPIVGFSILNPVTLPGEDALGLDQLTLAQSVPEPATLLLAGGALFAASRRQRARHA